MRVTTSHSSGQSPVSTKPDPLDIIKCRPDCPPIIELRGFCRGMVRHLLRALQDAAIFEVSGNTSRPKSVVDHLRFKASFLTPPFYHRPGFNTVKGPLR